VAYKKRKKKEKEKAKRKKELQPKPQSIPEAAPEEEIIIASKSLVNENLKIEKLKKQKQSKKTKTKKPVVRITTPVSSKKVEAKRKVSKPQNGEPVQAEIDNTIDAIPTPDDLPQSETSNLMFMDLDLINEQNIPVKSVLISLSNEKGELLRNYYSDISGNVDLELKPNRTYMVRIEHKDFRSKTIMVCTDNKKAKEHINRKILMKSENKLIELNAEPIYFGKQNVGLQQLEQDKLNKTIEILKQNPSVTIRINGYADALEGEKNGFDLSKKRALVVAKYLIRKGIDPSRMMPKGKGANELQNDCGVGVSCSDRLHQQNRRVQIEVFKF